MWPSRSPRGTGLRPVKGVYPRRMSGIPLMKQSRSDPGGAGRSRSLRSCLIGRLWPIVADYRDHRRLVREGVYPRRMSGIPLMKQERSDRTALIDQDRSALASSAGYDRSSRITATTGQRPVALKDAAVAIFPWHGPPARGRRVLTPDERYSAHEARAQRPGGADRSRSLRSCLIGRVRPIVADYRDHGPEARGT